MKRKKLTKKQWLWIYGFCKWNENERKQIWSQFMNEPLNVTIWNIQLNLKYATLFLIIVKENFLWTCSTIFPQKPPLTYTYGAHHITQRWMNMVMQHEIWSNPPMFIHLLSPNSHEQANWLCTFWQLKWSDEPTFQSFKKDIICGLCKCNYLIALELSIA